MDIQRKKILFLITKSTLGGAQQYVYDLSVELLRNTYDVAVIAGGDGPLITMLKNKGIRVYPLKHLIRDISPLNELRTFLSLIRIIQKEKPDILHINSSKAGVIGSIAGRLCGVQKIIFTAHGWVFNEDRPSWQKKIFKLFHFLTVALSHKTICVSDGMRAQMQWPFIQKKMHTVHHGRSNVELQSKDNARNALVMRGQNGVRLLEYRTDFWVGTIAELHPIKRIDRAIDSVSLLIKDFPNLRYVIIHDGQLRAKLEQQVRDLKIEEHVFFMGTLENAAQLLPAFDAFILPSKSEAFGYVLIEAGQAHLPVVTTNVGGIPDIITDDVNGLLVPPDDTPALTDALHRLLSDTILRARLADAHHEKSILFTVEKMVQETIEIYTE